MSHCNCSNVYILIYLIPYIWDAILLYILHDLYLSEFLFSQCLFVNHWNTTLSSPGITKVISFNTHHFALSFACMRKKGYKITITHVFFTILHHFLYIFEVLLWNVSRSRCLLQSGSAWNPLRRHYACWDIQSDTSHYCISGFASVRSYIYIFIICLLYHYYTCIWGPILETFRCMV